VSAVPAARALRRLGRFELVRELGRGAQATVWLAHDTRLQREVALKLLDPAADAAELSEWLHEARAVSRLAHPHIVPVFEADVADGQPYLVFEFVDGPTLGAERRARPKWSAREAVQLLLGVLDALAAAHAQGIVHRDLKPANVMFDASKPPPFVRVVDFGIALLAPQGTPEARLTKEGHVAGTAAYMSPEQASGELALGPPTDVYALGMILREILTGKPPGLPERLGMLAPIVAAPERPRVAAAHGSFLDLAGELSAGRRRVAGEMAVAVSALMQKLALASGRFEVALLPLAEGAAHGLEQVEFRVGGLAGLEAKPLARVASGGELSRIGLAIQVIASRSASVPTLIFDEVDVGVGGRVAAQVGRKLQALAATRQVLCVTHMPQVAAHADQHVTVTRDNSASPTTRITPLGGKARVAEIARMLSGHEVGAATERMARELIESARRPD